MPSSPQEPKPNAGGHRAISGLHARQCKSSPARFLSQRSAQHKHIDEVGGQRRPRILEPEHRNGALKISIKKDRHQHRRGQQQHADEDPNGADAPAPQPTQELAKARGAACGISHKDGRSERSELAKCRQVLLRNWQRQVPGGNRENRPPAEPCPCIGEHEKAGQRVSLRCGQAWPAMCFAKRLAYRHNHQLFDGRNVVRPTRYVNVVYGRDVGTSRTRASPTYAAAAPIQDVPIPFLCRSVSWVGTTTEFQTEGGDEFLEHQRRVIKGMSC